MNREKLYRLYHQITPDMEFCNRFLDLVNDDDLENIRHLGLILIAPESFALGVVNKLADKFQQSGLLALDVELLDPLTEDQIASMFIPGWIPERFRFWLIQRRFLMGPTVAILVTHLGAEPICDTLQRAKGHRIPFNAAAGTWRGELPSINGVLDLVHTADGPAYVLRNGSPFFSAKRIVTALQGVCSVRKGELPSLSWDKIKCYGLVGNGEIGLKCNVFLMVYFKVLQRIIARQWLRQPNSFLESAQNEINTVLTKKVSKYPKESGGVFRAIWAVAQCEGYCEPVPRYLIILLTRLHNAHQVSWDQVMSKFDEAGITLDRWEFLILLTTLYYTDQELPEELLDACRELDSKT